MKKYKGGFKKGHPHYPAKVKSVYEEKGCVRCGERVRPTSGHQKFCVECGVERDRERRRIYLRKYYKINWEKEAVRKHIWYMKNRAVINKKRSAKYKKNK